MTTEPNGDEIAEAVRAANDSLGYYGVIGRSVIEAGLRAALPMIEQRLREQWTAEMDDKLCGDPCPTRPGTRCDLPAGHDAHRRAGSGLVWWTEPASESVGAV